LGTNRITDLFERAQPGNEIRGAGVAGHLECVNAHEEVLCGRRVVRAHQDEVLVHGWSAETEGAQVRQRTCTKRRLQRAPGGAEQFTIAALRHGALEVVLCVALRKEHVVRFRTVTAKNGALT